MDIEDVKQRELQQSDLDVLTADKERWLRMVGGGHLDDWLAYGPGLLIRRKFAMKLANSNRPEGSRYNSMFGQLLEDDGLDTMEKSAISNILWLHDDPERLIILREIRNGMTPGQRARLNSPQAARQRVAAVLKAPAGVTKDNQKQSQVVEIYRQLDEQRRENADLEKRLAEAENRDGSLFDLHNDEASRIAGVIIYTVSESKAKAIADCIRALLKKRASVRDEA